MVTKKKWLTAALAGSFIDSLSNGNYLQLCVLNAPGKLTVNNNGKRLTVDSAAAAAGAGAGDDDDDDATGYPIQTPSKGK